MDFNLDHRCHPLPYYEHATITFPSNDHGMIATITCQLGYTFHEDRIVKQLFCAEDHDQWLPQDDDLCKGIPIRKKNNSYAKTYYQEISCISMNKDVLYEIYYNYV